MESNLLWKSVLGEIELNVNPAIFATWFKKTQLISCTDDELVVGVPNTFAQKQLETQFQPLVKQALSKTRLSNRSLKYRITSASREADTIKEGLLVPSSSKTGKVWQQNSPALNEKYTFDNFIEGDGNNLAYAASRAVANNLGCKYNPLFVYGGVGIGKTHLIQAIGNEALKQNPSLKVVYVTTEQFVQEFTSAIRYKAAGAFTQHYRNVDVLIIDDMQFIANKEKTQEEFFHTFNVLHEAGKQIVISSDKPPHAIPTLEERLQSRFQMGMMADMRVPDFETRCAILKLKADKINLKIEAECVEFLARNVATNIRALEGTLNQLNAFCESHHVVLATLQLAQNILDEQHFRKKRVTSKQVLEKVSRYYQVSLPDLTGSKRDKEIVVPRQVAMYLLRDKLQLSFPKIAKTLGKKDHTTAIHSVDKIEKQLVYDEETQRAVKDLEDALKV